jgi:hypothetical protein
MTWWNIRWESLAGIVNAAILGSALNAKRKTNILAALEYTTSFYLYGLEAKMWSASSHYPGLEVILATHSRNLGVVANYRSKFLLFGGS